MSAKRDEGERDSAMSAERKAGSEPDTEQAPGEAAAPAPGAGSAPDEAPAGEAAEGAVSAPGPAGPRRKSRRFPRITRDTARPEGGGRAASGTAPAPARQWPMLTVLTVTALGLLITATGVFRVGTVLIGVGLLTGAVLRRVLPSVGMLAVRSRFTDMVTYGALGVAITLLALMAQPDPVLEIPFLDETLHFTISS